MSSTEATSDAINQAEAPPSEAVQPVIEDERFRQVSKLLTQLKIEKFASVFLENEVDDEAIKLLTEDSLKEIGLPLGPRVKLIAYIKEMNNLETPKSKAPSVQNRKSGSSDAGSKTTEDDEDSVTELDESINESEEKPTQSKKEATSGSSSASKASKVSQTSPTQVKSTKTSSEMIESKKAQPKAEKPKSAGCCSRFGRFIVSTLYYIFLFPFIAIYRGLVWFTTRILIPVLPLALLTPISLPLWLFYLSEITADQMRGTFHPMFSAVSLTFLIATPIAVLGLQMLWYLWLKNPELFSNSSPQSTSNNQTAKAKED